MTNKHATLLITILLLALTGCATKSSNQEPNPVQAELAQYRQQHAQLSDLNGQLEKHLEECQLSAREITSDIDAARAREAELRQRLASEIRDKNIELEYLKGRLTVRMLDRILFLSGSAEILPEGKDVLDKLTAAIATTSDLIRVVGHTDNVRIGAELQHKYPSNWELSGARAASVVRYFQRSHGIDPLRMEAVGLSKYRPLVPNDSDENRQRNRRIEVVLTARDQ